MHVLGKDEGNRQTPFSMNFRPHLRFSFRLTDVTGSIDELSDDREMVMLGDNMGITVKLPLPTVMNEGFALRHA
jgi:elongation factor Tu